MGFNTTVHVGYYVVAKKLPVTSVSTQVQCSNVAKHKLSGSSSFCPHCGHKVWDVAVPKTEYVSLSKVQWGVRGPVVEDIGSVDAEWLTKTFCHIPSVFIGFRNVDEEVLLICQFNNSIDADNEGVHALDRNNVPSDQYITEVCSKLQHLMQYSKVTMHYGVLVQLA